MKAKICLDDVLIYCPNPECDKLLDLPSPNKNKINLLAGLRIAAYTCGCGEKLRYWQRFEKDPPHGSWDRRYCTYIELAVEKSGNSIMISCPVCGIELTLSPPLGKRPGHRSGLERTSFVCNACAGYFSYWGWIIMVKGKRFYKIRLKIPKLDQQMLLWRRRQEHG